MTDLKVAYLVSKYPAVSHTFILREVAALRARGARVGTFSVRRPTQADVLDTQAAGEAAVTRWLVGAPLREYVLALLAALRWPLRLARVLAGAVAQREMTLRQRAQWLCYFGEALLLARWLKAGRYHHLHCHFGNNGSSTGLLAARLAGIPFSFTCHGSELLDSRRNRLREKVALAAFVACVSKYGRAQLMLQCPPEQWSKLHIVRCAPPETESSDGGYGKAQPYSAELARGGQGSSSPRHGRATARTTGTCACPCPSGNPADESAESGRLLCVARLSREKGHLVLLDALALLRDRGQRTRCTLAGDGPMRAAIEARAAELKLGGQLTLAGSLCPEAVMELYRSAQVVILPSFSEGVPVTLMEAMSQGVPVVATRVGGVTELVHHGRDGLLVAPGDAHELAEAIGKLLARPALASRMGRRACRHLRMEFDLDRSVNRLMRLLEPACSLSPARNAQGELSCPPTLANAGF